jgi:ribosomal protein S18 acetylase RimI-like enzyme
MVRTAGPDDADAVARLLYDFNREYDDPTPEPPRLAERVRLLLTEGHNRILLAGDGPDGVAVLRFRPALWSFALECHLAELYVVPALRRRGIGRALMEASIELAGRAGADYMDLATSEDDAPARALYESLGFVNREGRDGPVAYHYEREL